jgi:N-acetylmuramic acid 6-phosphate etherase
MGHIFGTLTAMHEDRSHLLTETRLPGSLTLDTMPVEQAVKLMAEQDAVAVAAVATQAAQLAAAVDMVSAALRAGGRLIYVGAGSSGRLGVLDASECPPTFRSDPDQVQGIIAGGDAAMFRAQEGAEDNAAGGAAAVDQRQAGPGDVIMGIAAGGTTPFVHGALRQATARGAKTIFLSCVQPSAAEAPADVVIRPLTGPEVITGSTRLKAGTATKLVLNTISTLAMVQLNKVYENLMVDLRASNAKLRDRAARIVSTLGGADRVTADDLLNRAGGHVKLAIVMHKKGIGPDAAARLLESAGGSLRAVIG